MKILFDTITSLFVYLSHRWQVIPPANYTNALRDSLNFAMAYDGDFTHDRTAYLLRGSDMINEIGESLFYSASLTRAYLEQNNTLLGLSIMIPIIIAAIYRFNVVPMITDWTWDRMSTLFNPMTLPLPGQSLERYQLIEINQRMEPIFRLLRELNRQTVNTIREERERILRLRFRMEENDFLLFNQDELIDPHRYLAHIDALRAAQSQLRQTFAQVYSMRYETLNTIDAQFSEWVARPGLNEAVRAHMWNQLGQINYGFSSILSDLRDSITMYDGLLSDSVQFVANLLINYASFTNLFL